MADQLAEIKGTHIAWTRQIDANTIWLLAKVERLKAVIKELQDHSAARERTYNLLTTALDGYKTKVERLTAELKDDRGVRAVVMNAEYAELDGLPEKSMRICEAIRSLRQQVERLKAELSTLREANGRLESLGRVGGIEEAARLFNDLGDGFLDRNAIQNMILAAKEQTDG